MTYQTRNIDSFKSILKTFDLHFERDEVNPSIINFVFLEEDGTKRSVVPSCDHLISIYRVEIQETFQYLTKSGKPRKYYLSEKEFKKLQEEYVSLETPLTDAESG